MRVRGELLEACFGGACRRGRGEAGDGAASCSRWEGSQGNMRVFSCTLLQHSCSARHLPLLTFHPAGRNIVCLFGRTASVSRPLFRMLLHIDTRDGAQRVSRWIGNVLIPCSLSMMPIERTIVRLPRRRELRGRSPSSCRWVLTLAIRHPTHITCRRKGVQCDGQKP
jgi:hypothetical protein